MPLNVVNEDQIGGAAVNLFWQGFNLGFPYIGDAGMGGFWTSQNMAHATALTTEGAGPCQIIIVHCTNGQGALGHYGAHPNPLMILQGVQSMVNALPGAVVDTILFAAGNIADRPEQLRYELRIVAQSRLLVPGARVRWPVQNPDDNWGSVMYLPQTGDVALFHSFPHNVHGRLGAGNGLAPHNY
jgi:hypothetical protein